MQAVLTVKTLPTSGLAASAAFFGEHLERAKAMLDDDRVAALAIVLPSANSDHDDWRRALAADLAREYAPKRINLVGSGDKAATTRIIEYLKDAPGVTGQYCPTHE